MFLGPRSLSSLKNAMFAHDVYAKFRIDKNIALSWHNNSNKKYIGISGINIKSEDTTQDKANWDEVYRNFIDIEPVNSFYHDYKQSIGNGCYMFDAEYTSDRLTVIMYTDNRVAEGELLKVYERYGLYSQLPHTDIFYDDGKELDTTDLYDGPPFYLPIYIKLSESFKIFILNPENGTYSEQSFSRSEEPSYSVASFLNNYWVYASPDITYTSYRFTEFKTFTSSIKDGKIKWVDRVYKNEAEDGRGNFKTMEISETIVFDTSQINHSPYVLYNDEVQYCILLQDIRDNVCIFIEKFTGIKFQVHIDTIFPNYSMGDWGGWVSILNFYHKEENDNEKFPTEFRHIVITTSHRFYTIKTTLSDTFIDILSKLVED